MELSFVILILILSSCSGCSYLEQIIANSSGEIEFDIFLPINVCNKYWQDNRPISLQYVCNDIGDTVYAMEYYNDSYCSTNGSIQATFVNGTDGNIVHCDNIPCGVSITGFSDSRCNGHHNEFYNSLMYATKICYHDTVDNESQYFTCGYDDTLNATYWKTETWFGNTNCEGEPSEVDYMYSGCSNATDYKYNEIQCVQ